MSNPSAAACGRSRTGRTVVDSEAVLLVHRQGQPPTYAIPEADVHGIGSRPLPDAPGTVAVDWDAVDAWFEEDEEVHGHPRNPYHRVDCLRASRRLQVAAVGTDAGRHGRDPRRLRDRTRPSALRAPPPRPDGRARTQHHHDLLPLQGNGQLLDGPHRRRDDPRRRMELRGSPARIDAPRAASSASTMPGSPCSTTCPPRADPRQGPLRPSR